MRLPTCLEASVAGRIQAGRGKLAVGWYKYAKNGWQAQESRRECSLLKSVDI